jgi:site-specific DNA-methyltransferase (cytosine-N4-specific)
MSYKLILGDTLETLKTFPDESIQCCITSPPYYGLRAYGTEPKVWGGDPDCNHTWGEEIRYAKRDTRPPDVKASQGAVVGNSRNSINFAVGSSGRHCLTCNAWLGELGLEPNPAIYLDSLTDIFREVKRILKPDGACWVNLGDSYTNLSLMQIPARFSLRMTDELGFILRNEIIWHKPSTMPSSAKNRFTVDFEPIFFYAKSKNYKFNQQIEDGVIPVGTRGAKASEERSGEEKVNSRPAKYHTYTGKRNKRTTWSVTFEPQKVKHYASYPTKLISPMVLSTTDPGDTVLDPFNGTGTTGVVSLSTGRNYIGIDLQPEYIRISEERLSNVR